jgi:aminoglycoside phosphotransferase (APT) family kinase protein
MHVDELDIDVSLVRRLLVGQFPQWAELSLEPVTSAGTDNALYRLGHDMVVRLPRILQGIDAVEKEQRWLPKLAPLLPVAIPVPLAKGAPAEGYPSEWSIYRWLDGENPTAGAITDLPALAGDIIRFLDALHRIDIAGAPPSRRGAPLEMQDEEARSALAQLDGIIDTDAATAAWDDALKVPAWAGPPLWVHGDLLPGNLLVQGGRLTGIIDWAAMGVGDPACDMLAAWSLFPPGARERFRLVLDVDDTTWARGRGWALSIGLIALPYYQVTNPALAATARHLIDQVLADHEREA